MSRIMISLMTPYRRSVLAGHLSWRVTRKTRGLRTSHQHMPPIHPFEAVVQPDLYRTLQGDGAHHASYASSGQETRGWSEGRRARRRRTPHSVVPLALAQLTQATDPAGSQTYFLDSATASGSCSSGFNSLDYQTVPSASSVGASYTNLRDADFCNPPPRRPSLRRTSPPSYTSAPTFHQRGTQRLPVRPEQRLLEQPRGR